MRPRMGNDSTLIERRYSEKWCAKIENVIAIGPIARCSLGVDCS